MVDAEDDEARVRGSHDQVEAVSAENTLVRTGKNKTGPSVFVRSWSAHIRRAKFQPTARLRCSIVAHVARVFRLGLSFRA